jgi:hypothetical protein
VVEILVALNYVPDQAYANYLMIAQTTKGNQEPHDFGMRIGKK